jgi:broad-specificity NMP kinase
LNQPLVVLLAGLPGSGKSAFAPYLAHELNGSVLDTDDLFAAPRIAVGAALGIGTQVVDEPQWREVVHGRRLSPIWCLDMMRVRLIKIHLLGP